MKKRLIRWLLRQIRAEVEALIIAEAMQIRAEAAQIAEELELRLDQKAAERLAEATRTFHQQPQPQRRFIGQ
jgi:hypothetical protein